jgi:hypothetical protein
MTKFLKFLRILDRGGMLCPWGQNIDIWTFFGVLTNGVRAHVSRVGTHRSNEWEGNRGWLPAIHAARDSGRNKVRYVYNNNMNYLRTPSFRQAPNVYNSPLYPLVLGAFGRTPPSVILYDTHIITLLCKYKNKNIFIVCIGVWARRAGDGTRLLRDATCPARDPRGPQKPPFLACQKVAPPPCKKCTKSAFPGRKVGIFDRFVHEIAHFWHLFCGHSSRPMGCQSVGKKPANLYSTKCRIFGPRTPPPVAPWWDTSSRRPHTGSRTPKSLFWWNQKIDLIIFRIGCLL